MLFLLHKNNIKKLIKIELKIIYSNISLEKLNVRHTDIQTYRTKS